MRTFLCLVWAVTLVLFAYPALAAEEPGTGVRVERSEAEWNSALAVSEVIRYADKSGDPEAFLVAARMLVDVKGPLSIEDLKGQAPKGADLKESVEQSKDVRSVESLLESARALAKDSPELLAKIDETERRAKTTDLTEWYDAYGGCWWGYCWGRWGCWRACW